MKHIKYINRLVILAGVIGATISCKGGNDDFDGCGQINATEITISAETTGKLIRLDIKEGDKIRKGLEVGVIDSTQTFLKKEELISRMNGLESKKTDIQCQTAAQYTRLNSLKKNLIRFENLLNKDAGTAKQVDDAKAEIDILERQIKAAEQNYRTGNENIDSERATLKVQIAQTEDLLKKCRIISPSDGTILTKYAEEGEIVSSGKPLFKIANLSDVYVKAYFTTRQLSQISLGDTVRVIPDDGTDQSREYEGIVTWISDEAEFTPKNIQTRDERADLVYAVKVNVHNDGKLRLGMYAYIKL